MVMPRREQQCPSTAQVAAAATHGWIVLAQQRAVGCGGLIHVRGKAMAVSKFTHISS